MKKILKELEKNLPQINIKHTDNEVDYYGFSYYLAKKLKLKKTPISISAFRHGWMHGDFKYPEELTMGVNRHKYLVATSKEVSFLQEHDITNVEAVGVPYIYIKQSDLKNIKRFKNSLLVMPPHSLPESSHSWEEEEYITLIKNLKNEFKYIVFCIHQTCIEKNLWIETLKKHNIPWIIGANAYDKNSLIRMAKIFKTFEYVTTNAFGSHIAYAAYSGCKVSIYGNFCEYSIKDFENVSLYKRYPFLLQQIVNIFSEKYIQEKYNYLFKSPKESKKMVSWAKEILGEENKVSYKKLGENLGWYYNDELINSKISNLSYANYYRNFYNQIQELNKHPYKYIIYGAGSIGKTINALLKDKTYFIDQESNNIADVFYETEIYSPNNINLMNFDFIIISVLGKEESIIYKLNKLNIPLSKIVTFDINHTIKWGKI